VFKFIAKSSLTYFVFFRMNIVFDFDSTFISTECLDELVKITLKGNPKKVEIIEEFERITSEGMSGKLPISESLEQRLKLLNGNRGHISILIPRLQKQVSPSILRNRKFFKINNERIYILSAGFKEFVVPVVSKFGIAPDHVFANTFTFDVNGNITGLDKNNLLSQNGGKIKQLKELGLKGETCIIGDGYTDLELKQAGLANKFYAFTENVLRDNVAKGSDHVTPSFDEFLFINKFPMTISYPKNRIKVLLLEKIHEQAVSTFKREGYNVEYIEKSLSEKELAKKINNVTILGIRSKTNLTRNVLKEANKLLAVGAFCIGTNQIDLEFATRKGVVIFNAPFSNTRSVVELALGEIIMLTRDIFRKSTMLHNGLWDKSSSASHEIRGKKLGIIGYGNIGSQLSVVAEALGMDVYFFDLSEKLALSNATKCKTLRELLKKSDIVTLHIDGNPGNRNFIGENEFRQMKDGVIFLNLSRGFVVDINALRRNLENGKIRGAAIDVFPDEPESNYQKFKCELSGFDNVILTPHIGGSTEEAQENIASFVSSKIIDFINIGTTSLSVNFPNLQLPEVKNAHRLIHIHQNVPGILAKINNTLASYNINILGQYLKTNEEIGYVITDISKNYNKSLLKELKEIPQTIKLRILY